MSVAQGPTKADKAIEAVKQLCLTGTQYNLKTDAQGNLTLLKLAPGAAGSVSVNVRSSPGAAAIFDDKLRKEADEDIRACIKPYIQKIVDAILQDDLAEHTSSGKPIVQPSLLIEIIKNQQLSNVRKSYGEAAGQNFSDRDLNEFVRQGRDRAIADNLKNNNDFLTALLALKHMNPTDRQHLFTQSVTTYRQTWAELGRIDPKGQTEAGQEADKMIAKAIVELATDLILLSDDEIRKLRK
jgi:hypothetical protein